jgi:hypothetical protein
MPKLEIFIYQPESGKPPQIITTEKNFTIEVSLRDVEGKFYRAAVDVQNFDGLEAVSMLRALADQLESMLKTNPPIEH